MSQEATGESDSREPLPPDTIVEFEVVLRYRVAQQELLDAEAQRLLAGESLGPPAERADRSADSADIDAVSSFAARVGFKVIHIDPVARRVRLSGTAGTVSRVFHVTLVVRTTAKGSWRECESDPIVPREIQPLIQAVLGLSQRPVATKTN